MYYDKLIKEMLPAQEAKGPSMKNEPAFFRRLEESMDVNRKKRGLMYLKPRWDKTVLDLTTSDFLSLNRTGRIREAFLEELNKCGDFELSASGSRLQYGNYDYLLQVEREVAAFHGAETAWICHSGFFANVGVLEAIPQPGDAVVYDDLSHASTYLGLKVCLAAHKLPFKHRDPDSLRDVLNGLKALDPAFATGDKSILISVESIYSMEGDICWNLKELVDVAKELFPAGNAQFVIDEAHSNGVIGPKGAGLVSMLGLEKDIAIRVHMCSKALASTGGVIMCNSTVRSAIVQYSKTMTYAGAPSVPMIASIRAGYQLLNSCATQEQRDQIQSIVKYFFQTLLEDPACEKALDEGLISVPLAEDWEDRPIHSHIVPIKVRGNHEISLSVHLLQANMNAYPIHYPIVPKGTGRIRCVFHAHNTRDEVDRLVAAVGEWATEMLEIERDGAENTLPSAMRRAFAMQATGWQE